MSRPIGQSSASQRMPPSPLLREYVRCYDYIAACQRDQAVQPVTARIHPRMAFTLDTPLQAYEYARNASRVLPLVTMTGPLSCRVADIAAVGASATILSITFEPTGFFRLFRVPTGLLLNYAHDCADILGPEIKILHARLCEARDFAQMVKIIEEMLLARLQAGAVPTSWIQHAAEMLQKSQGMTDLAVIRSTVGLSERQVRRQFINQTGLAPKSFSQVLRFNNALNLKRRFPDRLWTQICVDAGYYDQSHMHVDFMELGGEAPSRLMQSFSVAPGLMPL